MEQWTESIVTASLLLKRTFENISIQDDDGHNNQQQNPHLLMDSIDNNSNLYLYAPDNFKHGNNCFTVFFEHVKKIFSNSNLDMKYINLNLGKLNNKTLNLYASYDKIPHFLKIKYNDEIDVLDLIKFNCLQVDYKIYEGPNNHTFEVGGKILIVHNFNNKSMNLIVKSFIKEKNDSLRCIQDVKFEISDKEYIVIDKSGVDKVIICISELFNEKIITPCTKFGIYITNSSINNICLQNDPNISYTFYYYKHLFLSMYTYSKSNYNFNIDNFLTRINYVRFFFHTLFLYHISCQKQYRLDLVVNNNIGGKVLLTCK